MIIDPLLTELWIVALCCIVNGVPGYVHADVVSAVAAAAARCLRAGTAVA